MLLHLLEASSYHLQGIRDARDRFDHLGHHGRLLDATREMEQGSKNYLQEKHHMKIAKDMMTTEPEKTVKVNDFVTTTRGIAGVSWIFAYCLNYLRGRFTTPILQPEPDVDHELVVLQELQQNTVSMTPMWVC